MFLHTKRGTSSHPDARVVITLVRSEKNGQEAEIEIIRRGGKTRLVYLKEGEQVVLTERRSRTMFS